MAFESKTPSPGKTLSPPPRLERVPTGYTPPPIRQGMTPAPLAGSGLQTVAVTAEAAIRAGVHQRGDLAKDSALRLFHLAAARRASGRLRIRAEGVEVVITFRSGVPEHVQSSSPSDGLVRFLLERGIVKPDALVDQDAEDGADYALVSALLSKREADEVGRLVKEHGAGLATRALRVERGEWEWEPHDHTRSLGAPLGSPLELLAQAVRAMDPATLRRRLGERCARRATLVIGAYAIEEMGLSPQELAAAACFDGEVSPEDVVASSFTDEGTVLRAALLLFETGLLAARG